MHSRSIILTCLAWISLQVHAEYSIVHYERAYELIYRRLYHQREVPFRDIVFAIENAYSGDSLNYEEYIQEIERMTSALHRQAEAYAPSMPSKEMAIFKAISSCYCEPNEANRGRPFSYDMLPTLRHNYPQYGLVTSLLRTGRGTCRSLPFLFKILADELGVEAYITLAPKHYFIRHQDSWGNWWNFETTIGRYLQSDAIAELTELHPAGIRSKLYMEPLRGNELMAVCLQDLIHAFYLRTGLRSDPFIRRWYGLGLLFYPNCALLLTQLYNDRRALLCNRAIAAGVKDSVELKTRPDFQEEYRYVESIRARIDSLGYQEWSDGYLERYLQRMRDYVAKHPEEFKE